MPSGCRARGAHIGDLNVESAGWHPGSGNSQHTEVAHCELRPANGGACRVNVQAPILRGSLRVLVDKSLSGSAADEVSAGILELLRAAVTPLVRADRVRVNVNADCQRRRAGG